VCSTNLLKLSLAFVFKRHDVKLRVNCVLAHVSSTYILMSRAHTSCLRTRHYHTNNIWHQWRFWSLLAAKSFGKLVVQHFRLSNFTFYLNQNFWATYHVISCHQNRRFSSWIVGCLNNVTCACYGSQHPALDFIFGPVVFTGFQMIVETVNWGLLICAALCPLMVFLGFLTCKQLSGVRYDWGLRRPFSDFTACSHRGWTISKQVQAWEWFTLRLRW